MRSSSGTGWGTNVEGLWRSSSCMRFESETEELPFAAFIKKRKRNVCPAGVEYRRVNRQCHSTLTITLKRHAGSRMVRYFPKRCNLFELVGDCLPCLIALEGRSGVVIDRIVLGPLQPLKEKRGGFIDVFRRRLVREKRAPGNK